MHILKAALLVLGLVTVALPALGKTVRESDNEQSYQLFNKQRTHRGRRAHDEIGSGRVISHDLINRFTALKSPSSGSTTIITSPTTTTITLSPTTTSPTTTSPTSTLTFPTSTTTADSPTTTTNITSRNLVGVGFANLDDENDFENDEDVSPIVLQQLNRYSIDKYGNEDDDEDDVAIVDTAVEYGRAARARPSNWRRRQRRRRQQQRRRRRQAMRRRQRRQRRRRQRRQRLRRQQRRRNQQRRRKAGRNTVRRGNGGRNRRRRRIVRVNA